MSELLLGRHSVLHSHCMLWCLLRLRTAAVELSKEYDETIISATIDPEGDVKEEEAVQHGVLPTRPSTAGRVDFNYSKTSLVREAMEGMCDEDRAFHVERTQREREALSKIRRFSLNEALPLV